MNPFTILLLRPDYIADPFGQDTYLAHVAARDVPDAVRAARQEVVAADSGEDGDMDDYYVLCIFEGHLSDQRYPA